MNQDKRVIKYRRPVTMAIGGKIVVVGYEWHTKYAPLRDLKAVR